MAKKIYNKLIRDNIPKVIKDSGKVCDVNILNFEDFKLELDRKLFEELKEYMVEKNSDKQVEELADIVEVIYAILDSNGVSRDEFERVRLKKREVKGGFEDRFFLNSVDEG